MIVQTLPNQYISFDPNQIGGLGLWLDSDDASTITLNVSDVSQWNDKSGNARHASQGTPANQPAYATGVLSGKPIVRFNGSSEFFNMGTGLDWLAGISHTAFVVALTTNYTNFYGAAQGGQGAQSLHVGFNNSSRYRINYWGNDTYPLISANFNVGQFNVLTFEWPLGGQKYAYANGLQEPFGVTGPSGGSIQPMAGGGRIVNVVGQGYFGGDIAEILIYGQILSQVERLAVTNYLVEKWGI